MSSQLEEQGGRSISLLLNRPGERLDKALAEALPDMSRSQIQRLITEGEITINGKRVKASQKLDKAEKISIIIPKLKPFILEADRIPLDIVYEDEDLILVNKPAGMVIHPSAGHDRGTLVNAILAYCPDLQGVGGEMRPGIIHRLDKETSGLVLVAKNDNSLRLLQKQFKKRTVKKRYLALVEGVYPHQETLIDAPIGRDPRNRKKMSVIFPGSSARSRPAQTTLIRLVTMGDYTLLECRPITGRTHQIRVHLAFSGFPIVGDKVYGRRKKRLDLGRHFLHAYALAFSRPSDGKFLSFQTPLPQDLSGVFVELGFPIPDLG